MIKTRLLGVVGIACVLAACGVPAEVTPTLAPAAAASATQAADLNAIKSYLLGKSAELNRASSALKQASDQYYTLAKAANFDYAQLWANNRAEAIAAIAAGRAAWMLASPGYEQMEGIVAGTPSLAQFDVDLDAGSSSADDPASAVSFDLTLPDGRVLQKPGNLFGITESTLWGTAPEFTAPVAADFDTDGQVEFGEALPDANALKGSVDLLAAMSADLGTAATAWVPTESDAFTALVVMVPTMNEYFGSWKDSRFVAGDASAQRDFVAISRLADIQNILGSLQVVHESVSPRIASVDAAQDAQIAAGLADLKAFVADVYTQEQQGKIFSAEEADTLGAEAQARADAITGKVAQAAAQLNVAIAE